MTGQNPGEPKPRRKRRTTTALTDIIISAANAEFGKFGYSGATTAAIARRADVTEAQIFRLFNSKEELFHAAIFRPLNEHFSAFMQEERGEALEGDAIRTSSHRYIGALQDFMEQNARMLTSMAIASAYSPDSSQRVSQMEGLQAYFAHGAQLMTRRVGTAAEVDPALMVRVSFAAVLASVMFKDWLFPKGTSEDAIRHATAAFVTDGIHIKDSGRV